MNKEMAGKASDWWRVYKPPLKGLVEIKHKVAGINNDL